MTTIAISYSDQGFAPTEASATPGDTITVTNDAKDEISLSFSCPSTKTPLDGLTSPVSLSGGGTPATGTVRDAAANHPITFTVDKAACVVTVGVAPHQVTASPTSLEPKELQVSPGNDMVFFNESDKTSVTLEIDSAVTDPFGPKVGMQPVIAPQGQVRGSVVSATAGKKIKLTIKGSTGPVSTIDVRSGDD